MLLAYTNKHGGPLLEVVAKEFLHTGEVRSYNTLELIGGDDVRVVAVCLKIDDL